MTPHAQQSRMHRALESNLKRSSQARIALKNIHEKNGGFDTIGTKSRVRSALADVSNEDLPVERNLFEGTAKPGPQTDGLM